MSSERGYLVTGAAGFIGSHLCEALLEAGHRVVGIDCFDSYYDPKIKRSNVATLREHERFTLIEGDIRNADMLETCFKKHKSDVVVHLAARAGVRNSVEDPLYCTENNVSGTVTLLQAAVERGIERFVFGSSSSVYGATNQVPFSEDQDISRPVSPYAASKVAGEAYCYSYHHLYDLPVVCLRFFTVFGPRQRPDLAINKFSQLMLAGKPLPVYGDGSASRDFTYVGDIVRGIMAAGETAELASPQTFEVINLGSDTPYTVMNLVQALELLLGIQATIDWQPPCPGDVPITWANIEKARRVLGWEPKTTLADGLRAFAQWCREQNGIVAPRKGH